MNYVQYLSVKQIMYIIGESSMICKDKDSNNLRHQKIYTIVAFGQAMEKFNKTKAQKANLENIMCQTLMFFVTGYNADDVDVEQIQMKAKLNIIYIHSGVGSF